MLLAPPPTFRARLATVQNRGEDHEWYPTTRQILAAVIRDARQDPLWKNSKNRHILDIGAGDGKALEAFRILQPRQLSALEKSPTLQQSLAPDIFILGADFWQTSLHDKPPGLIFSNPPYSTFETWAEKIIAEAPESSLIYLVLPTRWQSSALIRQELQARSLTPQILGTYNFQNAEDRRARVTIHLLKIPVPQPEAWDDLSRCPFTRFFNQHFQYPEPPPEDAPAAAPAAPTTIVERENFIEALCRLHDARLAALQENYRSICSLDYTLLSEFEITKGGLMKSLQNKIAATRKEYWKRLFDGMDTLRERLTTASRNTMASRLNGYTGIEFNRENAYAVVLWAIRNANQFFDEQLIATYEKLVTLATVENYASNKRVFQTHRFRYDSVQDKTFTHYRLKLGHRMVLNRAGGLQRGSFRYQTGLCETAAAFLSDLLTVASNLGFRVTSPHPRPYQWDDSHPHLFHFKADSGSLETLYRVRAFQNWNLHIQLHPDFVHALNIHHGRLRGWLRNDMHASDELEIPVEIAIRHFSHDYTIQPRALLSEPSPP